MLVSEKKIELEKIKLVEAETIGEIADTLNAVLYSPNVLLKQKIIAELCTYFNKKFQDERFKIRPLIAYYYGEPVGFVNCMIHPDYTTYSRKCTTFGWLSYISPEVCSKLIIGVDKFARENRLKKVRGNINFPKGLGGIGIQTKGFEVDPLYGVAFNNPNISYIKDLEQLGYKYESKYACLRVDVRSWEKGKKIHPDIEFRYYSTKKIFDMLVEIKELAAQAFRSILPDTSGGDHKYSELFRLQALYSPPAYDIHAKFNFSEITEQQKFIETWTSCNLNKINPLMPMAFDKKDNKLVGILMGIPNIYEHWLGKEIHTMNVDTAIVHPEYGGKGIFSALNNIGQLTCQFFRPTVFEGTYVWINSAKGVNNEKAINSIFPHCTPIREHIVVQKRVK
ncbi:MAG: hypothetical protein ACTSR8_14160 [Promethearchaeota archaeon]